MLKKFLTCLVLVLFCAATLAYTPVLANEELSVAAKLDRVETMIYGDPTPGSLIDRINKVEKNIFGYPVDGSIIDRAHSLYIFVCVTSDDAPSMLAKVNAAEWRLLQEVEVSKNSIESRIESLEMMIGLNAGDDCLDTRLKKILEMTFDVDTINAVPVILPAETLVKIQILDTINTKHTKKGDKVRIKASQDVFIGDVLVIPSGAEGSAVIVNTKPAKSFGRDAKLEIDFYSVKAIDNVEIPTVLGDKAQAETLSVARAAGASVAGAILLGPFGFIGGSFVNGENINIQEGAEMYIQTKEDVEAFGILIDR
ncbi:hypothetical protein LJC10_01185 [Selenomonadales bacterium OttesenSCG-928-I06]|nr:hypothetical protein [Selenomonadales bacterium OttesenSCG-928-I06]